MSESIGFIGAGAMGSAIASRLVENYQLYVNDFNPRAADSLVERGASFADLDQVAVSCRVIFLSLPGPKDVLELLLSDEGLVSRLQPGTLIIDTTTSTPMVDEQIVDGLAVVKGSYVDSPIAGGVRRAYSGDATLMVGGEPADYARAEPYLRAVTSQVHHMGTVGAGHTAKLVNNLLNACHRFSALETVTLAERYGIPRSRMIDVLNDSSGRSYVTEYTYPQFVDTGARQGFTLDLLLKDITLANELAEHAGHEMGIGSLVRKNLVDAVERFGPKTDQTDLMTGWYATKTDTP